MPDAEGGKEGIDGPHLYPILSTSVSESSSLDVVGAVWDEEGKRFESLLLRLSDAARLSDGRIVAVRRGT